MSDSSGFQYRSLKISRFSLKVALLRETLVTVQNFMLSGKYLVMATMMTMTMTIYFMADTAVNLVLWLNPIFCAILCLKCQQHVVFPNSHPPEYYSRPRLLNCDDIMGAGVVHLAWPFRLHDLHLTYAQKKNIFFVHK